MNEKWYVQSKKADFNLIAKKFNISPILARIIRNRDIIEDKDIENYLNPNIEKLSSPWLMKDMDKAVDILKIKIACGLKIRIIADYDVDGICSGYILYKTLKNLGAHVDIVIPHRVEDGYGISNSLVEKAYEDKVDTILTCDNGISAIEQVKLAKSYGITVIITDHHEIPYIKDNDEKKYSVPDADAVINPKQNDCAYPFKGLCGAMVAYQLMVALYDSLGRNKNELNDLLVYGAMATVCDVMDLQGENRIVVKYGIDRIKTIKDIGLNVLINECSLDKTKISAFHFGFVLGPCLNASGRLDSAKKGLDLLLEEDFQKAVSKAVELRKLNEERKELTEQGVKKALKIAEDCQDNVLVIYLPECHESIAGIIAGRVREHTNKPTHILTDSEGCLKGSGRSIEEYNMYEELNKVSDILLKFGGHKLAAGMSLDKNNLINFRNRLNDNCTLTKEDLYLKVWIDMQLPLEYVTINLVKELELVSPCGKGNLAPVFAQKDLKIIKMQIRGKTGNVISLTVESRQGYRMEAMIFSRTSEFMEMLMNRHGENEVNLALQGKPNNITFMATFHPTINEFRGVSTLQIVIDRFC